MLLSVTIFRSFIVMFAYLVRHSTNLEIEGHHRLDQRTQDQWRVAAGNIPSVSHQSRHRGLLLCHTHFRRMLSMVLGSAANKERGQILSKLTGEGGPMKELEWQYSCYADLHPRLP